MKSEKCGPDCQGHSTGTEVGLASEDGCHGNAQRFRYALSQCELQIEKLEALPVRPYALKSSGAAFSLMLGVKPLQICKRIWLRKFNPYITAIPICYQNR